MNTKIEQFSELIKRSKNTVFFGGAGVSTESGIPDFRSESGLYATQKVYGYPPEELLSYHMFKKKPVLFFCYHKENLVSMDAKPNAAHIALAKLEVKGLLQTIITQNVDGLHQAAGSMNVLELHGSNWRHYCIACKEKYSLEYTLNHEHCRDEVVPICEKCGGIVRPDVVLYEENLDKETINQTIKAIKSAELLIVGGTSLVVYPAAGLLNHFRGENLVLINKSETPHDDEAQLVIHEAIGEVFHEILMLLDI